MAPDSVEMQDIRGLDIDKALKGFELTAYIFKGLVNNSSTNGDAIRWYQETAADLTTTSPSVNANVSPLSTFPTLEVSWTRNTSYPRKYANEGFISIEDIKSADIDVFARTILRLTRAVAKQVDTRIYNILTETQTPVNIGSSNAVGGGWDAANTNPIADLLSGAQAIATNNYDTGGLVVAMNPKNYKDLMVYLTTTGGSNWTQYASEKVQTGVVGSLLGMKLVVSNNVVADSVSVSLPSTAVTWKSLMPLSSKVIDDPGIGKKIRIWEQGEAILTDPKASYLITETDL